MAYINPAVPDESTFTEGSSGVVASGGEFNDASADVVAGKIAGVRITKKRAAHANLRDATGTELGTAASPLSVNIITGGGGAVTVADGADVAEGATTDAAVATDVAGTVSGKLRGLVKIFADVWDSANHWLLVKAVQSTPLTKSFANAWPVAPAGTTGGASLSVAGTSTSLTTSLAGLGTTLVSLTGTWVGTVQFLLGDALSATVAVNAFNLTTKAVESTTTVNGEWLIPVNGASFVTVKFLARTSGTVSVLMAATGGNSVLTAILEALPAGTNTIGAVNQGSSPWVVSGTATVSGALTHNNAAPAATNVGALVGLANAAAPVFVEGDQVLLSLDLAGNARIVESRPGSTTSVVDLLAATDATRVLTILAANAARRGATIRNDTDQALMIREGGSASATNYTEILPAGARYTLDYPASTGILTAYLPQVPNGRLIATERS